MLAAWYERIGPAEEVLQVGEMEKPRPGSGEVLVRLRTSGVNPSDVKSRDGRPMAFPRVVPHSDGAGTVEAVGEGVDTSRVGERVWTYNAQFGRPLGTAAEFVALPEAQASPLPDAADFAVGACLGIPALTAHRCVFVDGPVAGKTVLVSGGAGAVGHAAVQLAKWGGAHVIATASTPEKAAVARDAGADHVIDYRSEDVAARVRKITAGEGVDHVVEVAFGANLAVVHATLRPNGTIAAYDSDVEEPSIPFRDLLRNGTTLRFVLVYILSEEARKAAVADVNACLEAGALRPVVARRFRLSDIAAAHEAVENGRTIGNVVIDIDRRGD